MKVTNQQWDAEYASGRWDFLSARHEQTRLAVVASFIANYAPGCVLDLGGGRGDLLRWCPPASVSRYIDVDVSQVAMADVPEQPFPVEKHVMSLADYRPGATGIDCIVASEVLYFVDDAASHIDAIAKEAGGVTGIVISLVAANRKKPNWEKASGRIWSQFDDLGWPLHQSVHVHNHSNDAGWDLRFYLFDRD